MRRGLPDIVADAYIKTETAENCIKHIFCEPGFSARERYVLREERWRRQQFLGHGSYGNVYLEICESSNGIQKLRAIKEVKKFVHPGDEIDYFRELEAIYKFSHPKVRLSSCSHACRV